MTESLNFRDQASPVSDVNPGSDALASRILTQAYEEHGLRGQERTSSGGTVQTLDFAVSDPLNAIQVAQVGGDTSGKVKRSGTGGNGEDFANMTPSQIMQKLEREVNERGQTFSDPIAPGGGVGSNLELSRLVGRTAPISAPEGSNPGNQAAKVTAEVPSEKQIGKDWDQAYNSETKVAAELEQAVSDAYKSGGVKGLAQLQDQLNAKIKADGAGPALVLNGNKVEIHNIQSFTAAQTALLPKSEQEALKQLNTVDSKVNAKELTPIDTVTLPTTPVSGDNGASKPPSLPDASINKIAGDWDKAFSEQNKVTKELQDAARNAYAADGIKGLEKLQSDLNRDIVADKAGPLFSVSNSKIEIHQMRGAFVDKSAPASADSGSDSTVKSVLGDIKGQELAPVSTIDAPVKKPRI